MNQELSPEPYKRNEAEQKSLDLFHEGQILAAIGEVENALAKIEESLVLARNNNDPEWTAYLEGTVAYLNGDLEKLLSLVDRAGANIVTLTRLAKGLEARGAVDYKEDCYK
ncbi:MAG: hypothetical protein QG603_609 [Patescibacteria group bacterium]|nr:hypothetical protein [Patescibacteria group bacterium]